MNYGAATRTPNNNEPMTGREKTGSSKWLGFFSVILCLVIWAGLVYGGFYFTKQNLTKEIKNIQQTNALNIQELKERMDSLMNEMIALKGGLSSTDETLSSSSSIQEELNEKIEVLDRQLKTLEKSLQILKEAP